jgi:hypothetical protein
MIMEFIGVMSFGRWEFSVGEQGALGVFGADGGGEAFEWPGDVKGGVAPEDAALSGGMVEAGGFVEDLCGIGEDEEAVGEAFRDPEELEGVGTKVEASPFSEVGGVGAEVYGYVPDVAGEDADELSLGLFELVMEPPKDAFRGEGLVIL